MPPLFSRADPQGGTALLLTSHSSLCRHCTAPSRTRSCSGPCKYPCRGCCCMVLGGQRVHPAPEATQAMMLQGRFPCEDEDRRGSLGWVGLGCRQCTPGCPQHCRGGRFSSMLGESHLRPASCSFGMGLCLGGCAQGGLSITASGGAVAVPGPHRVPAPSPTAAIPSSRSGSACAAGINQRGATQC